MKRMVSMILCVCLLCVCTGVLAKNGDIITYTKHTNIVAYVNHYAIQSYNINDTTCVGAEDLGNFGFNVEWNGNSRSLHITRNYETNDIQQYSIPYETDPNLLGLDDLPVYETDIKTYVNGIIAPSYNIGGRTVVDFESLNVFGEVVWVPDVRALKLWVEDGLEILNYMQSPQKLPRTTVYSADGRTKSVLKSEVDAYLKVGWYASEKEAKAVGNSEKNKKAVGKFYVGQRVMQNFIVMTKYGIVESIDSTNGKIKVYWNEIRDSYGNSKQGSTEVMLYGLYSSQWEDASALTPIR